MFKKMFFWSYGYKLCLQAMEIKQFSLMGRCWMLPTIWVILGFTILVRTFAIHNIGKQSHVLLNDSWTAFFSMDSL